ncbi:MAG: hypothetical protein JWM95_1008 [Gemmatimonadetes bacterium]|nr:hypothetical protein [Gemmatimonadota bacterium]
MKRLFYAGVVLLVLFELANVWFIMPMPYSQRVRSVDVAYALYRWRWAFRIGFGAMIAAGLMTAMRSRIAVAVSLLVLAGVVYATNFVMAADVMFIAPTSLNMQPASRNAVESSRLVVGIDVAGEARAYPVQFIGYHHQVRDTVAGKPVMVSFCTVCRTGRVFIPMVEGKEESFRLVGMDHFNAMFEDRTTGSWWRQANGEAIAGPRKGMELAEYPSRQVTLTEWLSLYPKSLIMQADTALRSKYSASYDYESGASRGALTGTDTASWRDKSWVVGISVGKASRAYDWNRLTRESVVNDSLGGKAIVLVLARDRQSFFAFERPSAATMVLRGDSLVSGSAAYAFTGLGAAGRLAPLKASQEFWHSWRSFQPGTSRY